MAVKTRNVENLFNQLNRAFPNRDKSSDGWIGDKAHQGRTSGHNPDDTSGSKPAWDGDPDNVAEVRDADVDDDFRTPGVTGQKVVDHLRSLPNLRSVCRYLIYNGFWYHERDGFVKTPFDGNPHQEHIHFEGAWTQAADNNSTYNFHFERLTEDDMPTAKEIADAVVVRLTEELEKDGPENKASALVRALRRIPLQYPFATGGTLFNVMDSLREFLSNSKGKAK